MGSWTAAHQLLLHLQCPHGARLPAGPAMGRRRLPVAGMLLSSPLCSWPCRCSPATPPPPCRSRYERYYLDALHFNADGQKLVADIMIKAIEKHVPALRYSWVRMSWICCMAAGWCAVRLHCRPYGPTWVELLGLRDEVQCSFALLQNGCNALPFSCDQAANQLSPGSMLQPAVQQRRHRLNACVCPRRPLCGCSW